MMGNMFNVTPREQCHPETKAQKPKDDTVVPEGVHEYFTWNGWFSLCYGIHPFLNKTCTETV